MSFFAEGPVCQKPFANAAAEGSHSYKSGFFACAVMKVLVIDERFSCSLNTFDVGRILLELLEGTHYIMPLLEQFVLPMACCVIKLD